MSNNEDVTRPDSIINTVDLPVDEIVPDPNQPRKTCTPAEIDNLRQSITATGQISPIVVKRGSDWKYVIVVGERRWRAIKEASIPHIKCIVRDDIDDQKALEMQLAENCQREDIAPLEQAWSFKAYLDKYGVSQRELSRRTGIPQRTISARLALLSLPVSMHAQIESGAIGPYEALKLFELPTGQQKAVADAIASGRIGGRMLEKLVGQVRVYPEKPLEEILKELTSSVAIVPLPIKNTDGHEDSATPVMNRNSSLAPQIAESQRQAPEVKLASIPAEADILSELATLLSAAKEFGAENQVSCNYLNEEGVCDLGQWEDKDNVPEHGGKPIKIGDRWYLKPSILYCALCPDPSARLADVEFQLDADPLAGIKYLFECDCGVKGEIAVAVKCTKCGEETWWGWWPKES